MHIQRTVLQIQLAIDVCRRLVDYGCFDHDPLKAIILKTTLSNASLCASNELPSPPSPFATTPFFPFVPPPPATKSVSLYVLRMRSRSVTCCRDSLSNGMRVPCTDCARCDDGSRDAVADLGVTLMARRSVVVDCRPKRRKESAIWWEIC